VRHLRLAGRRAPRGVLVEAARKLRRLGAKTRYVVWLRGVASRDAALGLVGAELFVRRDDDAVESDDEDLALLDEVSALDELEDARAYAGDLGGDFLGTVFDVLDPTPESGLAQPLIELELPFDGERGDNGDRRRHCYVPLGEPLVREYDPNTHSLALDLPPGLLDLAFVYEPPPPVIRGLLPPPGWRWVAAAAEGAGGDGVDGVA